jgi:hypothetical protein
MAPITKKSPVEKGKHNMANTVARLELNDRKFCILIGGIKRTVLSGDFTTSEFLSFYWFSDQQEEE